MSNPTVTVTSQGLTAEPASTAAHVATGKAVKVSISKPVVKLANTAAGMGMAVPTPLPAEGASKGDSVPANGTPVASDTLANAQAAQGKALGSPESSQSDPSKPAEGAPSASPDSTPGKPLEGSQTAADATQATSPTPNVAEGQQEPEDGKGKFAERFAKLAKKERQLTETQRQLKAEQEQLAKDRAEVARFREAQKYAKQNPMKVFETLGVPWNDVMEYALRNPDAIPTDQDLLRNEIQALKQKAQAYEENERRKQEQSEQWGITEGINRYKAALSSFLQDNADKYELINLRGANETVFDVIARHHEKTGTILEMNKAADLVERSLKQDFDSVYSKSRYYNNKSDQSTAPQSTQSSAPASAQAGKTLTVAHTGASTSPSPHNHLSRAESLKLLKQRLKGW